VTSSDHAASRAHEPAALRAFSRALGWLSALTIALAGIALVGLVAMMGWLVFGRYVLNDTPTWIERAATLAILAIAMPVAAVGVRERFHLSVLGVRESLPPALQRWIALACDVLMGLFGAGMAWWSGNSWAWSAPSRSRCSASAKAGPTCHGRRRRADGAVRHRAGAARHLCARGA
jgi:TRAP-type C4-dicarboxylate transport system permease small subunit